MGCLREIYGILWILCYFHVISMIFHGLPMGFKQDFHGTSMICSEDFFGNSKGFP